MNKCKCNNTKLEPIDHLGFTYYKDLGILINTDHVTFMCENCHKLAALATKEYFKLSAIKTIGMILYV